MRLVLAAAVAAAVASAAAAPAAPVPNDSPALPSGPYPPFDLTYLSRIKDQGLIAVRPAAVVKFAPLPGLSDASRVLLGMTLSQLVDCDLTTADPPPFAALDQVVMNLTVKISGATADKQGSFLLTASSPCTFRTAEPFPWAEVVRKWFPKATAARHAGREYLRTAFKLDPAAADGVAVFVADGRTLVFDSESGVKELLDRLKAGKPHPIPPPGWDAVARDLLAVALDQRTTPCVTGAWPTEPPAIGDVKVIVESLAVAAFGLTAGERTGLRVVAEAKDEAAAAATVKAIDRLVGTARPLLALATAPAGPEAALFKLADGWVTNLKRGHAGPHLRVQTDGPGNLLALVGAAMKESDAAAGGADTFGGPPPATPPHPRLRQALPGRMGPPDVPDSIPLPQVPPLPPAVVPAGGMKMGAGGR